MSEAAEPICRSRINAYYTATNWSAQTHCHLRNPADISKYSGVTWFHGNSQRTETAGLVPHKSYRCSLDLLSSMRELAFSQDLLARRAAAAHPSTVALSPRLVTVAGPKGLPALVARPRPQPSVTGRYACRAVACQAAICLAEFKVSSSRSCTVYRKPLRDNAAQP